MSEEASSKKSPIESSIHSILPTNGKAIDYKLVCIYVYIYNPTSTLRTSSSASHSIHRYPTFSRFRNTSSSEKINISIYTTTYRSDTSWLKHGNIREGTYSRRDIDMGSCCRLLRVAGHLHFHRGVHSLCREGK